MRPDAEEDAWTVEHRIVRLDHVNVAMPAGEEALADSFYKELLGFTVRPKAEGAPGRWYVGEGFEVHLGVDPQFRAAKTAHPAIVVSGIDRLAERLEAADAAWEWDRSDPSTRRILAFDPFGNRVELIAAKE